MQHSARIFCSALTIGHALACSGMASQTESNNLDGGSSGAGGVSLMAGTTSNGVGGSGASTGGVSGNGGAGNSLGGSGGCYGTPTLGTVSAAALQTELSQLPRQLLLINVHTPLAGNIPGTDADIVYTNVPAIETFIGTDKSKPVVIYCWSDHMATIAGPQLVADGYCSVRYLTGGLSAWEAAGYSVDP
jgi:rhodanese-related sulfurtransferase